MNYSLNEIPDSGKNPVVYFDIDLGGENIGRIFIKLLRDAFPAGVENFIKIAEGKTYNLKKMNTIYKCIKSTNRSYKGCKFFRMLHGNYIICGDIYNNDGTNAGTIYNDEPIPAIFGEYYYPHTVKGMVSLVPYVDDITGNTYYDSTFIITLDDAKPSNILQQLDNDYIVIGYVYQGLDVIDRINKLSKPYAGRKYPKFSISDSGVSGSAFKRTCRRINSRPENSIDNHIKRINTN